MNLARSFLASTLLAASLVAHAADFPTGALGGGAGPFLPLTTESLGAACVTTAEPSNDCALQGLAVIDGGWISHADQPFGGIAIEAGGNFLSGGVLNSSTISFDVGVTYVSFLWGSPSIDENVFVFLAPVDGVSAGRTFDITSGQLDFDMSTGAALPQYVQFFAPPGGFIASLTFSTDYSFSRDNFEMANFSVTRPVPEPQTYALMLAGLAVLGFVHRRRRHPA